MSDRTEPSPPPGDDAPHLLVVDDDTRIRNLLKQYLGENGFRVTVAGNAAEARRQLAGLDFDGHLVWQRNLQDDYGPYTAWWGHAGSPVLHQGLVISTCLHDSLSDLGGKQAESYVIAHDIRDGHVKWKTPRALGRA